MMRLAASFMSLLGFFLSIVTPFGRLEEREGMRQVPFVKAGDEEETGDAGWKLLVISS